MNDIKREELEKAFRNENCKVRIRAVTQSGRARHGTVQRQTEQPANPSTSYPAYPEMARPSTSKLAILVDGRIPGEFPKARCRMLNISGTGAVSWDETQLPACPTVSPCSPCTCSRQPGCLWSCWEEIIPSCGKYSPCLRQEGIHLSLEALLSGGPARVNV